MGGIGSGKGSRPKAWRSMKLKTSNLPGLCVPELMKMHKANPTSVFTFDGVSLEIVESFVYTVSMTNEKLAVSGFNIISMVCNYGGVRYFGECPFCQKKVRTLYFAETLIACRHCLKMGYSSQNQTLSKRLCLKLKKVKQRISGNEWEKPKWMRKKTFAKYRELYFDLDEKEQIANFFSLRSIKKVDAYFRKYGCVLAAAEDWEMQNFGSNPHPSLLPIYDSFLHEELRS